MIGGTDASTSGQGPQDARRIKGIMTSSTSDLRDKITRGMTGQALKGFHCGGRVYGYKLVPVADPTRKDCYGQPAKIGTRLDIDPEQDRWVTQIFQWYADGWSPLKIVNELNRLHVPAPGVSSWRKMPRTPVWSTAALHGELRRGTGMLNNPLYTGLYCWNRSRREKDPTRKEIPSLAASTTGSNAHAAPPADQRRNSGPASRHGEGRERGRARVPHAA